MVTLNVSSSHFSSLSLFFPLVSVFVSKYVFSRGCCLHKPINFQKKLSVFIFTFFLILDQCQCVILKNQFLIIHTHTYSLNFFFILIANLYILFASATATGHYWSGLEDFLLRSSPCQIQQNIELCIADLDQPNSKVADFRVPPPPQLPFTYARRQNFKDLYHHTQISKFYFRYITSNCLL